MKENKIPDPALAAAVNAAMVSASAGAWNAHQAKEFLNQRLPAMLADCPIEEVIQPDPAVAGPTIETLRHVVHEPVLANMLASLLAVAIDRRHAQIAHPAFANIVRNLSADEALLLAFFTKDPPLSLINLRWEYQADSGKQGGKEILQNFSHLALQAGCRHPLLCATYIDNLCRLGLVELPPFYQYLPESYAEIEADSLVRSLVADIEADPERVAMIERKGLRLTAMGRQFIRACLQ